MTMIISIVLLIVLVSASTYAVVVNVKENNEVLEIVNEVNIIDLVTDNDGVYNNTYYNVRNELDITDSEASIIIQSDSLNEALHLVMDINIRRLVGLGFKRDGRGLFKKLFDGLDGLYGRSEDFLYQLEKVYAINELVKAGYGERLKGDAIMITMANGKDKFKGNLKLEGELMDKLEMILSDAYIRNHEEMEVMGNYNRVNSYLTSAKSRGYFMKRIGNVSDVIRNEGSGKKAKKRSVMPAVFFIVCLVLIMVMVVVVMFYGGFLGK